MTLIVFIDTFWPLLLACAALSAMPALAIVLTRFQRRNDVRRMHWMRRP